MEEIMYQLDLIFNLYHPEVVEDQVTDDRKEPECFYKTFECNISFLELYVTFPHTSVCHIQHCGCARNKSSM